MLKRTGSRIPVFFLCVPSSSTLATGCFAFSPDGRSTVSRGNARGQTFSIVNYFWIPILINSPFILSAFPCPFQLSPWPAFSPRHRLRLSTFSKLSLSPAVLPPSPPTFVCHFHVSPSFSCWYSASHFLPLVLLRSPIFLDAHITRTLSSISLCSSSRLSDINPLAPATGSRTITSDRTVYDNSSLSFSFSNSVRYRWIKITQNQLVCFARATFKYTWNWGNVSNLGQKNSRRAWHVIPAQ